MKALVAGAKTILDKSATEFQVLDVSPIECEDMKALDAARSRLARLYHPDRFSGTDHEKLANDVMARVNQAHTFLSDKAWRVRYLKAVLPKTHFPCQSCNGAGEKRLQKGFAGSVWRECPACKGAGWLPK